MPSSGMLARVSEKNALLEIYRANTYQGVGDSKGRKLRDQEVGGSNPLAPTNSLNRLQAVSGRNVRPFALRQAIALENLAAKPGLYGGQLDL